jgi:hypothetical protein
MTFLPTVVRAEYRGGFRIHVTFNDNAEKTIDFGRWLDGPVFEPLKDRAYFRRFFIEGGTVVWPNGADIAPETLYAVARGEWRPDRRLPPTKARGRARRSGARLRG